MDIVSTEYAGLDEKQGETDDQKWLMEHCYEYGFILRYPQDKSDDTGIIYEPWHYRYVGTEAALAIRDQGVTLEEYLNEEY
jgi:D-alanyl-D-alanine carboxypeptidase